MVDIDVFKRMKKKAARNGKGEAAEVYSVLEQAVKELNSVICKVEVLEARDGVD